MMILNILLTIISFFVLCCEPIFGEKISTNDSVLLSPLETYEYPDGLIPESVPRFNAILEETSLTGFSSGSYFASQFHLAYSSFIRGVGLIAGGPYSCVRQYPIVFNCIMDNRKFPLDLDPLLENARAAAKNQTIDPLENLIDSRVYIVALDNDNLVNIRVVQKQDEFYRYFVPSSNIFSERIHSVHAFPTDFDAKGNVPCGEFKRPYISNCQFDAAGNIFRHIYGMIAPRNDGAPLGKWIKFPQSELYEKPKSIGLGEFGYIYAPQACLNGEQCRVHIVFHGCRQSVDFFSYGMHFLKNSGFTRYADTNNIIVAFPQTDRVWVSSKSANYPVHLGRIIACWDMFGMYDTEFDNKRGVQIQAIRRLIQLMIES